MGQVLNVILAPSTKPIFFLELQVEERLRPRLLHRYTNFSVASARARRADSALTRRAASTGGSNDIVTLFLRQPQAPKRGGGEVLARPASRHVMVQD